MNKFLFGQVVITEGANEVFSKASLTADEFLHRHGNCDWGDVCAEDAENNDAAVIDNDLIISVYKLEAKNTVWIITEYDRSITTILTPGEY